MKICFIASNLDETNGNGRFVYSTVKTFQQLGAQTIILIERGENEVLGAKAILHKKGLFKKFIINPLKISWALRNTKTEIIHAFDAWPWGIWAYLTSLITGIPFGMTIYATYGVVPLTRPLQSLILRSAYRASRLNAAISNITAQKIKNFMPEANIKVINQGIDFDRYQASVRNNRIIEHPYILTVAYMKRRKGYDVALKTFAGLKHKFPELKYMIRASGTNNSYGKAILELAITLGISDDIIWLPKLSEEELIDIYKQAEIFFLPSISSHSFYFEGFGSVYLEAQACGIPVVTSRGGGQEDAIVNGKTGLLIEEGNHEQAIEALSLLLTDRKMHSEFSANAKEFARKMNWLDKTKEYFNFYNELK